MSNTKISRIWAGVGFVVSVLLLVIALLVLFNRQFVTDQLTVWSFKPSEGIETISDSVALTPKGQFIFYAAQPEVADQDVFNEGCPRQEAGSPILGCYTYEDKIYIYDITNQRLTGIEEVTAAHEMLHAVWYRHSDAERERLAELLNEAYGRIDDDTLTKRMQYYQRVEPNEVANELHSILGTEVSGLSDELEAYYSQYFSRSEVMDYHRQYSAVFTGLFNRSDELNASLEALATSIDASSQQYSVDLAQLTRDINSFNARADSGQFSSLSQFYAERSQLISRSADLESRRLAINADIATYETYSAEYQAIATELKMLDRSLDSFDSPEEAPSV